METYNINDILNKAICQLSHIKSGSDFLIKDLFTGIEWNSLPKNVRLQIGRLFLNYAENNNDKIEILQKNGSNHQKYRII